MMGINDEAQDIIYKNMCIDSDSLDPETAHMLHDEIAEQSAPSEHATATEERLLCNMGAFILAGIFVKR